MVMVPNMRSIFEYNNFREYIKDYYSHSKEFNKKFSFRFFARLAGFKSSNFIKLIIDGKSNVSESSALNLAKAMKLSQAEREFFVTLVHYNQATTADDRFRFAKQLLSTHTHRKIYPLKEAIFNYTSKWYLSLLRALVGLKTFKDDPTWISENAIDDLSKLDIETGFEDLQKLNLIKKSETGKWVQSAANVATDDEVAAGSVAQFHLEMMRLAGLSIDRVPRSERDISAITIGMSEETAKKIKTLVQKFRKEIVEVASQDETADSVYQLNIQLFPLFREKRRKDES